MKSKKKTICWFIAIVVIMIILAWIYHINQPKAVSGWKTVSVEVVDDQSSVKTYELKTDADTLKDLMDEMVTTEDFTYEGSDSSMGFYINTINGTTADYSKNAAYWAIYVNGDYGQYSADKQPVNDQDAFKLVYEQ